MPGFEWRPFLEAFSREMLADPRIADALPAAVRESGWLGFEGASEAAIAGAEARMGTVLPPSYREFLATTNGWRNVGAFIERAWPAEQVDWFRVRNQGWIDAYAGPMAGAGLPESAEGSGVYGDEQDPVDFPTDHLQSALEISEAGVADTLGNVAVRPRQLRPRPHARRFGERSRPPGEGALFVSDRPPNPGSKAISLDPLLRHLGRGAHRASRASPCRARESR